ncbi:cytochrome c biogenesis protein CcdA [Flexivirga sp. ID2601S]|uniref:Cytochrome c biogenesis protein CcdA n=1 Tax=Flexivirga aerilata TaxID=1656889 RepID=A0A849ALV7_9MICO|nr:cytochrome c biogenesis protein CcdA [Flexivirga aerilata]
MNNVSLLSALAAGTLSLLSPCSALLLPSFFAYAFSSRRALLARTTAFYVGLALVLVPLGTGTAAASRLMYGHRGQLILIAGWIIIGMGVVQLLGGGFRLPLTARLQTWAASRGAGRGGYLSTVALGAVYGLAGFCSGPVLGAILTMASTQGSKTLGGALLAVYALGMALPLFVLAWFWDRFHLGQRSWIRGKAFQIGPFQIHTTSLISGALFIVIGALFLLYDGTASLTGSLGLSDTTGLETSAQEAISRVTEAVPVWAFPLVIAVVASIIAVSRSRQQPTPPHGERSGLRHNRTRG